MSRTQQDFEFTFTPTWTHILQIIWYGVTQNEVTIICTNSIITFPVTDEEP